MCDILIVGVDSDDQVKRDKGPERPVIPEHQRVNMVSALKCVDVAFVMGNLQDFEQAVVAFCPRYIFKNQNFRPQDVIGGDRAQVVTVPDVCQADSTSGIIEEIKRAKNKPGVPQDIAAAPKLSTPSATPTSDEPPSAEGKAPNGGDSQTAGG